MSRDVTTERDRMRAALERWLAGRLPQASDLTLSDLRAPKGTGNSAETLFASVRYRLDTKDVDRELVVRRELNDTPLFLEADIRLPFNMMQALEAHPQVPSARAIGVETDPAVLGSPFLVMEAVAGRIVDQVPNYNVAGWVADLPVADRRAVWLAGIDAMARLHSLDWKEGFAFLDDRRRGAPGFEQYLNWTLDWYEWARAGRGLPVADKAKEYLLANRPANTETCVLWGDPTPANTLFAADNSVAALLDFEMAALGPGEADLVWWLEAEENFSTLSGIAKLEGLPGRKDIIARYETVRGREVRDLDYYSMLAWFRMNIVGIRFSDRLVANGRMPGGTDVLTHNPATMLMARRLGMDGYGAGEGFMLMARGMAGAG